MLLDVLVLPAVFASQPRALTEYRARTVSGLRDVPPLFEAYHHRTSSYCRRYLGHKVRLKIYPQLRMRRACLS